MYLQEEDNINVKMEADSVEDVQFPCTHIEHINVKKEVTEETSFVGVKMETECGVGYKSFIHIFIYFVVCLMTVSEPLPKQVFYRV